jgi:hypothetical protein
MDSTLRITTVRRRMFPLALYYATLVITPAWLSTITGVSNQLISGSEP